MEVEYDLSYIAGFFDGEGSVCITASHRKDRFVEYILQVGIGNTYFPILVYLHKRFGGSLHLNLSCQKRKATNKPFLQWCISAGKAVIFLEAILPYLIVKKTQAEVCIAFQKFKSSKRGGKAAHDPTRLTRMSIYRDELRETRLQGNNLQYTGQISRKGRQTA